VEILKRRLQGVPPKRRGRLAVEKRGEPGGKRGSTRGRRYTIPKTQAGWPVRPDPSRGPDPGLTGPAAWGHPAAAGWRRWTASSWEPRGCLVLITPCSNVKPYPRSPQSAKIRGALRRLGLWDPRGPGYRGAPLGVDWVYLSDLLGLVPYEAAHRYPACCYEYPPSLLTPRQEGELAEALAGALSRAARRGAVLVAYLPRRHASILRAALHAASPGPRVEWVPYHLFRGHRALERALARLAEEASGKGCGDGGVERGEGGR